ncbi:MAG: tetratricopeptide repeat protein [Gemmatimonadetes bacterium]|nr:tetratricopeptide repeat protein [Gemmatimonadota bacterium]
MRSWQLAPTFLAALAVGCGDRGGDAGGDLHAELPKDVEAARAEFAGAESCQGCHAEKYAAWVSSTHGRAGGEPSPETVIAPFDGTPIVFSDATVVPMLDSVGRYVFVVLQEGRSERRLTVDGVVGGGHLLGGGTQGFVTRVLDGTVRFIPFDYSRQLDRWFCNTTGRRDKGWVPITTELALADCGDWPPYRAIGTVATIVNCQGCHGSQITTRLEPGRGYRTEWTSLRINCESCHGPARGHVETMTAVASGQAVAVADIGLASRATDGVEESLEVCLQCHALRMTIKDGHLPGERLSDYSSHLLSLFEGTNYLPDGRIAFFAYQGTHLSSSCYVDGAMTCVSCHEPHGLGYWDINRAPLASVNDDRQCTGCHASKEVDPEAHTFHPPSSAGARCVSCHMPYLQQPAVGDQVPFARSDHTIPVPRPELDDRLGLTSACRGCHADRSDEEHQLQVERWWGDLKPLGPITEGLLSLGRTTGRALAARLLLHPEEPGVRTKVQGLLVFLRGWVRPGAALDSHAAESIRRMAESPDPDLRALALAALYVADPAGDAMKRALREPVATRRRFASALGILSQGMDARGDREGTESALRGARLALPGDASLAFALGTARGGGGEYGPAIEALEESLEIDSAQPALFVTLGVARKELGDTVGALREFERAISLNPYEGQAHLQIGNIRMRAGDLAGAISAYESAIAGTPELARAHLNLALALARSGRLEEAVLHGRDAIALEPREQGWRATVARMEAAAGMGRPR